MEAVVHASWAHIPWQMQLLVWRKLRTRRWLRLVAQQALTRATVTTPLVPPAYVCERVLRLVQALWVRRMPLVVVVELRVQPRHLRLPTCFGVLAASVATAVHIVIRHTYRVRVPFTALLRAWGICEPSAVAASALRCGDAFAGVCGDLWTVAAARQQQQQQAAAEEAEKEEEEEEETAMIVTKGARAGAPTGVAVQGGDEDGVDVRLCVTPPATTPRGELEGRSGGPRPWPIVAQPDADVCGSGANMVTVSPHKPASEGDTALLRPAATRPAAATAATVTIVCCAARREEEEEEEEEECGGGGARRGTVEATTAARRGASTLLTTH